MENTNTAICQTCLGNLELPINLFDSSYKDYLDILQRLLGLQLFVDSGEFIICRHCQGKIIWVSEFQASCLKSIHQLGNVNCKTELRENEDAETTPQTQRIQEIKIDRTTDLSGVDDNCSNASDSEDEYVPEERVKTRRSTAKYSRRTRASRKMAPRKSETIKSSRIKSRQIRSKRKQKSETEDDSSSYVDDNSDSDSDCKINRASKKRKRKVNTISDDENDDCESNYKQFPISEVSKAISEVDNYMTDMKNRKCIICDFIGRNASVLGAHMKNKHE